MTTWGAWPNRAGLDKLVGSTHRARYQLRPRLRYVGTWTAEVNGLPPGLKHPAVLVLAELTSWRARVF